MARKRAAVRKSGANIGNMSKRAAVSYVEYQLKKGQTVKEKIRILDKISVNIEIDLPSEGVNAQSFSQLTEFVEIAILTKIELVFQYILPGLVHEYIISLVESQRRLVEAFQTYRPLSSKTMAAAIASGYPKPSDMYFYDWSGSLIRDGIEVEYVPGDAATRKLPSVEISPSDGVHFTVSNNKGDSYEPEAIPYDVLFSWLEYGTCKAPPRPFFAVITPLVEEFVEKTITKFMESSHVDTGDFSWS